MDVSVTTPETDTGAAFVAGVAAAQAADATNTATEAVVAAEVAAADASTARERATEADVLALEAHARIDALQAALGDFQDDVVALANTPAPAPVEVNVGVPPLEEPSSEPVSEPPPPPAAPKREKKTKSGWGLDGWFGSR